MKLLALAGAGLIAAGTVIAAPASAQSYHHGYAHGYGHRGGYGYRHGGYGYHRGGYHRGYGHRPYGWGRHYRHCRVFHRFGHPVRRCY